MEDLTALMQSVDIISKHVPEGEYMKMCQSMHNLYKVIQKQTLPKPQRVARQPRPVDPDVWRERRKEYADLINAQSRRGRSTASSANQNTEEIERDRQRLNELHMYFSRF